MADTPPTTRVTRGEMMRRTSPNYIRLFVGGQLIANVYRDEEARFIETLCNAAQQLNPDDPQTAADAIVGAVEALKILVEDIEAGQGVYLQNISDAKLVLSAFPGVRGDQT